MITRLLENHQKNHQGHWSKSRSTSKKPLKISNMKKNGSEHISHDEQRF